MVAIRKGLKLKNSERSFQWIKDSKKVSELTGLIADECVKQGGILDGDEMGKIVQKYLDNEVLMRMVKYVMDNPDKIPESVKNSEVYRKLIEIGEKQNGN